MSLLRTILAASLAPLALAAIASLAACDGAKATAKPPSTPASEAPAAGLDASPSTVPAGASAAVDTPGLHVSDAIARACGLPKQEVKPSFDFDSSSVAEPDRQVLAALARCLVDGPLKGRALALTGRADARGEDEYNMTLGEARADSVRRYLHDLGVQEERLRATSRGELDATGTDEAGWAQDRRVDIDLVN